MRLRTPSRGRKAKERDKGKVTVAFSASGYGSETQSFKSRDKAVESIGRDAAEIADAHGGDVVDYGNGEWVVTSSGGEEIARWEIG